MQRVAACKWLQKNAAMQNAQISMSTSRAHGHCWDLRAAKSSFVIQPACKCNARKEGGCACTLFDHILHRARWKQQRRRSGPFDGRPRLISRSNDSALDDAVKISKFMRHKKLSQSLICNQQQHHRNCTLLFNWTLCDWRNWCDLKQYCINWRGSLKANQIDFSACGACKNSDKNKITSADHHLTSTLGKINAASL